MTRHLSRNTRKPRISDRQLIEGFLSRKPVKLHIGCGTNFKETWINIDNNSDANIARLDLNWDLSKGIPFPNGSVDFIYHEHFIEHLSFEEGRVFLKECHRVLKKGGVTRIACPDLDDLITDYLNDTWREKDWVTTYKYEWIPSRAYMLNICLNQTPWGHKYVYNKEDLVAQLRAANFDSANISECEVNTSAFQELAGAETRADSMIFEAIK